MTVSDPLASLTPEALLALVVELQRQNAELQRQVAALTAGHEALRAEIDQLKRGGKRQAAPFAKGTRNPAPKCPGRQPGSGPFRSREVPPPEAVTEPPVEVPVTLDACPTCGGPLAEARVELADRTELPKRPRPKVTQYRVQGCRCTVCGTQRRGQHPEVVPDQVGATAHRVGARVMAAAQAVHDGLGIPVRKVPVVLGTLTGVRLTPGAMTQDALRRTAGAVGMAYTQLRARGPETPVVHTDDTGWRVGGEPAHLMAFATDLATVSQIRSRHRHEAVQAVMPAAYAGGMVTERGRSEDAQAVDRVAQPKCLAHILRSLSAVVERKTGRARAFGAPRKAVLQEALALWHEYRDGQVTDCKVEAEALQAALTFQRRDRRLTDPDHQRWLNALGWHHDRGNRRRFLEDPRIEPTHNRAERALRPAVIARKVSHCSQNGAGAPAFAAFTRVVRTLAKQGVDSLVENLYQLVRGLDVQATPP